MKRGAGWATVHGVAKRVGQDLMIKPQPTNTLKLPILTSAFFKFGDILSCTKPQN